jgi:hypothetical protein
MSHVVRILVTQLILTTVLGTLTPSPACAAERKRESIQLAADPSLSPDGKTLVFSWKGDIWAVSTSGGMAHQLTRHPAPERQPSFSPMARKSPSQQARRRSLAGLCDDAEGCIPCAELTTAKATRAGWSPTA